MTSSEKQVTYATKNTYATLNQLQDKTKNIWIVFHGIGFLSRYFLRYFDELDATENYIIAPQAPSKYYLNDQYRHVGASWLTKENTEMEKQNVLSYIGQVLKAENLPTDRNIIVFGFSQGVSIATRWLAHQQQKCKHLVLYAGGIPKELKPSDFKYLAGNNTSITIMLGDQDEFIPPKVYKEHKPEIHALFNGKANEIIFKGGHEMKKELLQQFT